MGRDFPEEELTALVDLYKVGWWVGEGDELPQLSPTNEAVMVGLESRSHAA